MLADSDNPKHRQFSRFNRGACYATIIDTEASERSTTTSTRTTAAAAPAPAPLLRGTAGTNQERINALAREILDDGNSSESDDEDASH